MKLQCGEGRRVACAFVIAARRQSSSLIAGLGESLYFGAEKSLMTTRTCKWHERSDRASRVQGIQTGVADGWRVKIRGLVARSSILLRRPALVRHLLFDFGDRVVDADLEDGLADLFRRRMRIAGAVSYTHLTLPTIYSV